MIRLPMHPDGGTPPCFGREWDPNESACAGGLDPVARDPRTGSHKREPCPLFTSCGARTQGAHQPAGTTLSAFYNQLANTTAAVSPQPIGASPIVTSVASLAPRPQPPLAPTPPPTAHPASMYQLNYVVPGYLSVPEPHAPGESVWRVLARLMVRAILKALGQELAYFADTHPLKRKDPPP